MGAANVSDTSRPVRRSDAGPDGSVSRSAHAPLASMRDLVGAYEAHARAVYSFAYFLCGRSRAEQITHDTFVWWWTYVQVEDANAMTQRMSLLGSAYECAVQAAGLPARSQLAMQEASVGLAYFGGLNCDQVAAILEEPSEAVKVHIQRGMLRLRPAGSQGSAGTARLA